jgi:CRP/FNR family cyclic AMP-dependent transcriptional regulator
MVTNAGREFKLQAKTARPILVKDLADDIAYLRRDDLIRPRDRKVQKLIYEHGTSQRFEVADQIYPLDPDEPAVLLMHRGAADLLLPSQPTPMFVKRIEEGFIFGEFPSIGLLMLGTIAQAATPSEVIILHQPAIKQIADTSPDIGVRLVHVFGPRFSECQRELKRAKFATLPSKIASLLLDLADEQGVVVGISERVIAERLAARRESVVAVISQMKRAGLVEVIGRQKFLLTNIDALRALKLF